MTTSTLTVTDFVLARIAEDEASVEEIVPSAREHPWAHEMCAKVHVPAERVLAQCAAMRKIVESVDPAQIEFWMAQDLVVGPLLETWQIRTLCAIASIWSDHTQFNPDWS